MTKPQQISDEKWNGLDPTVQKEIVRRIELVVKGCVKDKEVKIRMGERWQFDLKTKVLSFPVSGQSGIAHITKDEFLGSTLHEVGHAKYTKAVKPPKIDPKNAKDFHMFINAFEDIRIESKMQRHYIGTRDTFKQCWKKEEAKISEEFIKALPKHRQLLLNSYIAFKGGKEVWGEKTEKAQQLLETIKARYPRLKDLETTKDVEKWLVSNYWPSYVKLIEPEEEGEQEQSQQGESEDSQEENEQENKEQEQEEKEEQKEQKKDGKKEEKEKQDDKENQEGEQKEQEKDQGNGDGEDEEQEGDENEDTEEEEDKGNGEEEAKDEQEEQDSESDSGGDSEPEEEEKDLPQEEPAPEPEDFHELKQSMAKEGEEEGVDTSFLEQLINDMPEAEEEEEEEENKNIKYKQQHRTYEQILNNVKRYIPYFVTRLSSILKDNNARRFGGSYKKGKLATKHLYKFEVGEDTLFSQRVHRSHKKYSIALVIDQSGSMYGQEIRCAIDSAVLMAEVLDKIGIDFYISGLNNDYRTYKKFDHPYGNVQKDYMTRIEDMTSGGTNDAYAVNRAAFELAKQEGEKIMIVFSDGSPNPSSGTIPMEDQKRLRMKKRSYRDFDLAKEVENAEKTIQCIGVGIGSESVNNYYKRTAIIQHASELPETLLSIISSRIRRG